MEVRRLFLTLVFFLFIGTPVLAGEVTFTEPLEEIISEDIATAQSVSPDQSEVYQKLIAKKAQYPEGMAWTNDDKYTSIEGSMSGGGCHAFALILSDAAFGQLPFRKHTDINAVRVGDLLRINNNSHTVVVLEVNSDHFVIAEGNYHSKIHWFGKVSKTDTPIDYVVTRYVNNSNVGSSDKKVEHLYIRAISRHNYQIGETIQLEWLVRPEDASNQKVIFSSDDTRIATVNQNGLITATGTGSTVIRLVSEDNPLCTGSFSINVENPSGNETIPQCWIRLVSLPANGGVLKGSGKYDNNSRIMVSAEPNPGFSFTGWYNGSTKVSDSLNFTISLKTDLTLIAHFEENDNSEQSDRYVVNDAEPAADIPVYRLYNAFTGEHLYTISAYEKEVLVNHHNWNDEGIGWIAPRTGEPVYRLYQYSTGDHLYTKDFNELKILQLTGDWMADFEGQPCFYSYGPIPVYRLCNLTTNRHLITKDPVERACLVNIGWRDEGIAVNALH